MELRFPFLVSWPSAKVMLFLTPGFHPSHWEEEWVSFRGPVWEGEGRIMMCLEQYFLSNSGIKIPRS